MKSPEDRLFEGAGKQLWMVVHCLSFKHEPKLQSPIEKLMLQALIAYSLTDEIKIPTVDDVLSDGCWLIEIQKQIGQYRADFLLTDKAYGAKVVIECDGHDFHERTKEQAAHDRKRDRELQVQGYLVLRFTGSEIWRNPYKCADDIRHAIYQWHQSQHSA